MPRVDLVVRTAVARTPRARQLEALFDVPASEQSEREWHGEVPLDQRDWNIGLIVGDQYARGAGRFHGVRTGVVGHLRGQWQAAVR